MTSINRKFRVKQDATLLIQFKGRPVNSLLCQASTCFRIGSKLRCIWSTPTETQSIRENDFECFASTGVNTPGTVLRSFRGF
jgi:hypothetical protein